MPQHELQAELCIGSAVVEIPIYVEYIYHEGAPEIHEPGGLPIVPAERPSIEITGMKVFQDRKVWGQPPIFMDASVLMNALNSDQMQDIEEHILGEYE